MKILLCCFSATGNTQKIAQAIVSRLEELGAQADTWDITPLKNRERKVDLGNYDGMILGSPIHSMRAPRLVRKWIATLDGQDKKCAMFFTYGGFQVHPTHYDTCRRLEERGFQVKASAEFLGKHTFNLAGWQAMIGRPDQSDVETAREYAEEIYQRFNGHDRSAAPELDQGPYSQEQLDQFESFRYKMITTLPTRGGEECQQCLLCEEQCPTGAMDAEKGVADPDKCIVCLGCVQNCPEQALFIEGDASVFKLKMQMDQETPETLAAKKSRMYF